MKPRQYPLPHRLPRDHLIDKNRSALGHAPRAARGAKPAPLAGERHQLLVRAVNAAHAQKSVRQNPAFEKALELVPDKLQQARASPRFDLSEERLQMLPHQPMQERLLGPPPLVLDRVRRRGAQRWFALRFHPDANARTTTAGHRDLAGDAKGERKSTTGAARVLIEEMLRQASCDRCIRSTGKRASSQERAPYSHSIVAGGLPEIS